MAEGVIETKLREVGEDLFKDTVDLFDELELSKSSKPAKILMLTGPTQTKLFGEKLKEGIQKISSYEIKGPVVITEVNTSTIIDVVELAQKENVVATFGVGSGKICDINKKVGHDASTPQKSLYIINGLTAPSNDGFASPVVSIKDRVDEPPHSIKVSPPHAVLIYKDMILKSPINLIQAGWGDLSDKLLACDEWELETKLYRERKIGEERKPEILYVKKAAEECENAEMAAINVFMEMKESGPFDPSNPLWERGIMALTYGLGACGKAMTSLSPYSSRPCSGSGHALSHALDIVAPSPARHGKQVALGSRIAHFLAENYEKKFLRISYEKRVEIDNYVNRVDKRIKDAERLKIEPEYLIEALVKAKEISRGRPRLTRFDYLEDYHEPNIIIDKKFAEKLLKEIYII